MATDDEGPLDVVLVARHRFGGFPPLGDWQMARALGDAGHRVLYVEPPKVVRRPAGVPRALGRSDLRSVDDRLLVMTPLAAPGASRRGFVRLNDALLERQISRAAAATLSPEPVLASFDPLRGALRRVPRSVLVYWRRDRFDAYTSPVGPLLAGRERALMADADLVSCVAPSLVDEARRWSNGRVVYVPNGCDAEHFRRPRERPAGFPEAEVVVGFVGGSHWRLDRTLLDQMAQARPEWAFLVVGGRDETSASLPNIHPVSYVPYEDVPAWMQHLDVGLVPYDTSPFNLGSFPLKALEYLAAGVPVVSTRIPALEDFRPWIRIGDTTDEVVAAVEAALADGPTAASCRGVAAENTWAQRADALVSAIRVELARSLEPGPASPGPRPGE